MTKQSNNVESTHQTAPSFQHPVSRELWNQLGYAITLTAKQDQIVWTIFGIFWAANAVLLVALFTTGSLPKASVGMIVSVVGVVLSIVWSFIEKRAIGHLRFYEAIIQRIEIELRIPSEFTLSGHLNAELYKTKIGGGFRVRGIMIGGGIISAILWALSFLWFLIYG